MRINLSAEADKQLLFLVGQSGIEPIDPRSPAIVELVSAGCVELRWARALMDNADDMVCTGFEITERGYAAFKERSLVTKHRIELHCTNGHEVTIRYERADIGIEPTAPARLYAAPPIAPVASGVRTTWGVEQHCEHCEDVVRVSVVASRL